MIEIREAIAQKKRDIARLRSAVAELKEAEEDLKALERAYELMGGANEKSPQPKLSIEPTDKTQNLTISEAVEMILNKRKTPLHMDEILKEINVTYGKDTTKEALAVAIGRSMARHKIFIKTDPATYGLVTWYQKENDKNKKE
ncbi:MAG: HTH domain-containing protein [Thermodesulfobacteriota bacterium]